MATSTLVWLLVGMASRSCLKVLHSFTDLLVSGPVFCRSLLTKKRASLLSPVRVRAAAAGGPPLPQRKPQVVSKRPATMRPAAVAALFFALCLPSQSTFADRLASPEKPRSNVNMYNGQTIDAPRNRELESTMRTAKTSKNSKQSNKLGKRSTRESVKRSKSGKTTSKSSRTTKSSKNKLKSARTNKSSKNKSSKRATRQSKRGKSSNRSKATGNTKGSKDRGTIDAFMRDPDIVAQLGIIDEEDVLQLMQMERKKEEEQNESTV